MSESTIHCMIYYFLFSKNLIISIKPSPLGKRKMPIQCKLKSIYTHMHFLAFSYLITSNSLTNFNPYPAVKPMSTAAHHDNCCGWQDKG